MIPAVDIGRSTSLGILSVVYYYQNTQPPEIIISGGYSFGCSSSVFICLFGIGMGLFLVIHHLITFNH